jgi:hypothetical protein
VLISRISTALAVTATLACGLHAQTGSQCLQTFNPFASNNGGSVGGVVYMDIDTKGNNIAGTDFLVNTGIGAGTTIGLDLYLTPTTYIGSEQNPAAWTYAGSGTGTAANQDEPSLISGGFCIPAGNWGMALVAQGFGHRYTNGASAVGPNYTWSNPDIALTLGKAQNTPFSSTPFSPRLGNIIFCYNKVATPPSCASVASLGQSCGGNTSGYAGYEEFTSTSPIDITGYQLTFNSAAGTYSVTNGAVNSIVAPTASALNLNAGDDTVTEVTGLAPYATAFGPQSAIWICSNGYAFMTASGRGDFSATLAEFLAEGPRVAPLWEDYNPAASGGVYVEYDAVDPTLLHVTWLQVPEFGASTFNDIQLSIAANGDMEVKYGAGNTVATGLVGITSGNGTADPGALDVSSLATATSIGGGFSPNMDMATTDRPVLGTTVSSTVTGIPGSTVTAYMGFSFVPNAAPGLDLTGVGAPGCYLLGDTSEVLPFPVTGSTETVSLTIPTDVTLGGNTIYPQAIAIAPGMNQLGVVLSNGLAWTLGEN